MNRLTPMLRLSPQAAGERQHKSPKQPTSCNLTLITATAKTQFGLNWRLIMALVSANKVEMDGDFIGVAT
jgi:hypothetical protein